MPFWRRLGEAASASRSARRRSRSRIRARGPRRRRSPCALAPRSRAARRRARYASTPSTWSTTRCMPSLDAARSTPCTATGTIAWRNTSRAPVRELWLHLYLNAFKNERTVVLARARSARGAARRRSPTGATSTCASSSRASWTASISGPAPTRRPPAIPRTRPTSACRSPATSRRAERSPSTSRGTRKLPTRRRAHRATAGDFYMVGAVVSQDRAPRAERAVARTFPSTT